jgi:hypothetical protein
MAASQHCTKEAMDCSTRKFVCLPVVPPLHFLLAFVCYVHRNLKSADN